MYVQLFPKYRIKKVYFSFYKKNIRIFNFSFWLMCNIVLWIIYIRSDVYNLSCTCIVLYSYIVIRIHNEYFRYNLQFLRFFFLIKIFSQFRENYTFRQIKVKKKNWILVDNRNYTYFTHLDIFISTIYAWFISVANPFLWNAVANWRLTTELIFITSPCLY